MQKEIERKFLLTVDWETKIAPNCLSWNMIRQGYLSTDPVVRVRTYGDDGYITVKGNAKDGELGVDEYEYQIPFDDARKMLKTLCVNVIEKIRYRVSIDEHIWEVDKFLYENKGLEFCEVELKSENEDITLPNFVTDEVTGNKKYYNTFISLHPYSQWDL